jgi:nicotinamidase-related amidase
VICGCEAHVCVGQTVLSLLDHRRRVVVVADAIGSRAPESREIALNRMASYGAEIVTTEMVLFEWLRTAEHPQFRPVSKLIR